MKRVFGPSLLCLGFLLSCPPVYGQGKVGETAPDFPPGSFTDGAAYRLSDLKGKVVVLYFFEPG
jgi:hypothetical protein